MAINKLQKKIDSLFLIESRFGTWEYTPSDDKEELLYDFYVISMLPIPEDDNLAYVLKDTKEKMFSYMKKHMLDATFFAICCEFYHIDDENDDGVIYKFFKKIGGDPGYRFIQLYERTAHKQKIHKAVGAARWLLKDNPRSEGDYVKRYKATLSSIARSGITEADFIEYARQAFVELHWAAGYGHSAWSNICKGWQSLYYAKDFDTIMVAIDHIYDLEHNSDTIFDKVVAYYKSDVGYAWIQHALTHKRYIKDLHALIPLISSDLATFANAVMADAERIGSRGAAGEFLPAKGASMQAYQENLPGKKFEIGDQVYITTSKYEDFEDEEGTVSGFTEYKKGPGYMVTLNRPLNKKTAPFKANELRKIKSRAPVNQELKIGDKIEVVKGLSAVEHLSSEDFLPLKKGSVGTIIRISGEGPVLKLTKIPAKYLQWLKKERKIKDFIFQLEWDETASVRKINAN